MHIFDQGFPAPEKVIEYWFVDYHETALKRLDKRIGTIRKRALWVLRIILIPILASILFCFSLCLYALVHHTWSIALNEFLIAIFLTLNASWFYRAYVHTKKRLQEYELEQQKWSLLQTASRK